MEYASVTWEWIKRHIDTAFDDRLTDLLDEWDKQRQYIPELEKKLFREAKLNLCELESDLLIVENDVQSEDGLRASVSSALLGNLCISLEDFKEVDMLENEVPHKISHRLKLFMTKSLRKKMNETKLKDFNHNPSRVAKKRSEKLLESMTKDKDERLEMFVRDMLQRPFNYIRRLENTIPNLIESNNTLLERFELEILAEIKDRNQYVDMMVRIERVRRHLVMYGEDNFFASDFQEKDVKIITHCSRIKALYKRPSMGELMKHASGKGNMFISDYAHGLWHEGTFLNMN